MIISAAGGPVLPHNPLSTIKPRVMSILTRPDDSDWSILEEFAGGFWGTLNGKHASAWLSSVIATTQM